MESYEAFKDFIEYIKDNSKPWIKAGLVQNAPEKAKKAYQEWVKDEKERIKNGIT